jgi:hypothetical protein
MGQHPRLARAGGAADIICPIRAAIGNAIFDVTGSAPYQFADANTYRRWLRDAITVTNAALDTINLRGQVAVGFYGTSGFIVVGNVGNPKGFLDERILDAMSVLGMDDYPNPSVLVALHAGQLPLSSCSHRALCWLKPGSASLSPRSPLL